MSCENFSTDQAKIDFVWAGPDEGLEYLTSADLYYRGLEMHIIYSIHNVVSRPRTVRITRSMHIIIDKNILILRQVVSLKYAKGNVCNISGKMIFIENIKIGTCIMKNIHMSTCST